MSYTEDFRYCPSCRREVHFLSSLRQHFCVECGGETRAIPGLSPRALLVARGERALAEHLVAEGLPAWYPRKPVSSLRRRRRKFA